MPDLVPTVSLVEADAGSTAATTPTQGTALVAMTQLQPVYVNGNVLALADSNGNEARATAVGVTVNACKAGQPISYLTGGGLNPGCTLTVGHQYVVSPNSGKICDLNDLGPGDYVQYLFFADAPNHAVMNVGAQGVMTQIPAATTTTTTTTT